MAKSKKPYGRIAILSFDAFLFQSFGGPNQESDILPFLENVTRGRDVPRERLEVVANQYRLFGGKSPLNEINQGLILRIESEFARRGINLPIYYGNRNFTPYVHEALAQMQRDGRKRAMAFVTSAFGSFPGCKQYKLDIESARKATGIDAPEVVKIRHYYSHPGFINPLISNSVAALNRLPAPGSAELIFTAHSIPKAMADASPYLNQLTRATNLVVAGIEMQTGIAYPYSLAFQSRSGPPSQPWLEPDVSDQLRTLGERGVRNVVIVPISFISDHMEVVYDLDILVAEKARQLGIALVRAKTSSDSPEFVSMIADLAMELLDPSTIANSPGDAESLDECSTTCCTTRL